MIRISYRAAFILSTFFVTHPLSLTEKAYCALLGNQEASAEYKDLAHQALEAYGVTDAHKVPVKQMNGIGPRLVGMNDLASFTAYGIWINEEALKIYCKEQKIFTLYHEAAHYARNHHTQVLKNLVIFPAVIAGSVGTALYAHSNTLGATLGLVGSLLALSRLITVVQAQETTADLDAARKLIATGKRAVVQEHVTQLQKIAGRASSYADDMWHASLTKQINDLNECLSKN